MMRIYCKWEHAASAIAERQCKDVSEEQAVRLLTAEGGYINLASGNLFPFPSPSGNIEDAVDKLRHSREHRYQKVIDALCAAGKITFYSNLTGLRTGTPSPVKNSLVDMDELASLIVQHGEVVTATPKVEAVTVTTPAPAVQPDETDNGKKLAELFEPVTASALEKTFPAGGKWKNWAERASRNGLKNAARQGRGKFNLYNAAMWFVNQKITGWDLAHCNRVLVNNLPARSRDEAHLLTGDID